MSPNEMTDGELADALELVLIDAEDQGVVDEAVSRLRRGTVA